MGAPNKRHYRTQPALRSGVPPPHIKESLGRADTAATSQPQRPPSGSGNPRDNHLAC
jgi:hypothetical protein